MDKAFWQSRWEAKDLGFHQPRPNPLLVKHIDRLALPKSGRVFLPLCGKTLDIAWLLSRGYRVAGSELIRIAVDDLFVELGVTPRIKKMGDLLHYHTDDIDLFTGDIFHLTKDLLGHVDAVYDRAALVALPHNVRPRYAAHLDELTARARKLLICYEYDQTKLDGPPFSISPEEVRLHHPGRVLEHLECADVPGGLKGQCAAKESVWLVGS